jgi:hypothetical protein
MAKKGNGNCIVPKIVILPNDLELHGISSLPWE